MSITVAQLDENELISRFRKVLPPGDRTLLGSGDDCAVVAAPEQHFVVTTDVLVENRHFKHDWSTADDIGWRAAAQNLADIAAMGARPSCLVVSLVVPSNTEVDWLVDMVAGFGRACAEAGAEVVGGDLSAGDSLVIAVTAMGYCPDKVVPRSGAKVGDLVAVAGTLGFSAAGLELLTRGCGGSECEMFRQVFRAPQPPIASGPLAAQAGATAMMDISDGLLRDASRMAQASGVRFDLSSQLLEPFIAALTDAAEAIAPVSQVSADKLAQTWVLTGGEDHSLLATFAQNSSVPEGFTVIGTVLAADTQADHGVFLDGKAASASGGWDHFRKA